MSQETGKTWEDQGREGWKLDLDKIRRIWRSYDELGSKNAVANRLGYSRGTIYKYLRQLANKSLQEVESYDDPQILRVWRRLRRNLQSMVAPVADEEVRKSPLLCLVHYDPDTWEGYAYIVEDGVEKKAPVAFDPFRLVWTRKIVADSESSAD